MARKGRENVWSDGISDVLYRKVGNLELILQEKEWMKKYSVAMMMLLGTLVYAEQKNQGIPRDEKGYPWVQSAQEACAMFPRSVEEIEERSLRLQQEVRDRLVKILAVPANEHTAETLLQGFDVIDALFSENSLFSFVESVHPDATIRDAARKQKVILAQFDSEHIGRNKQLYQLFKAYAQDAVKKQQLSEDDRYYLEQQIKGWEHNGLNLPDETQKQLLVLTQRSIELVTEWYRTITLDARTIEVTEEQLAGISDDFKNGLERKGDLYVLRMDYPTRSMIMERCPVEETRKRYFKAFLNRAYPANEVTLQELVQKRHEVAQLLGYESFAAYDLALQMIKTPERAWNFLRDLQKRALPAAQKEFERLTSDLPYGVSLTADGKLDPWNFAYTATYFKKKYYSIDEYAFAEYFPMEETIAGLMSIYEQFFNLTIESVPTSDVWHSDVRLVCVRAKETGSVLGYVFLDMYPRPNKYTHARAHFPISAIRKDDGTRTAAVGGVICNFTKPTPEKPSLLRYGEVNTFFHEFGHALHAVLAATTYYGCAGTKMEMDFVEMPSQILENWLEQKEILKMISSHYQTGEPLPDDLIEKRLELLKFGGASFIGGQLSFGMFSLEVFGPHRTESLQDLWRHFVEESEPQLSFHTDTHYYCSFGHLGNYAAKYYGYLWSNVIACDVFEQIKKEGILSPAAGKKYVDAILGRGGSRDANDMVHDYLGRKPKFDAFYKNMGL